MENVTQHAASWKSLIYPFQSAVKKYAGVDYKTFMQQAFESAQNTTKKLSADEPHFIFPVNNKYVTNYYSPYAAGNDSLIYLKASYRQRPAFYIKDKSGEHKIKPGIFPLMNSLGIKTERLYMQLIKRILVGAGLTIV